MTRIWIEKTIARNRADRQSGSNRVGEALWSPQRSKDHRDIYANMRDAEPGDIVLHLVDNQAFTGVSRIANAADDTFTGLDNTDWAGQPCYRVQLRDYETLDPSFERGWIFNDESLAVEAKMIAREPRNRGIFYNDQLELNQGAYLTEASSRLASFLARIYRKHTGKALFPEDEIDSHSEVQIAKPMEPLASPPRAWVYSPGNQAMFWDDLYEAGRMSLGWSEIGDFRAYPTLGEMKAAHEHIWGAEKDPGQNANMCFEFANSVKSGDIIYAKRGRKTIIGRGIVTGLYDYDAERGEQPNIRPVQWTARGEWPWPDMLPMKTLTEVTDRKDQFEALFSNSLLIAEDSKPAVLSHETLPPYTMDEALDGLFMPREEFDRLLNVWREKQNLILQGAPGVGKSFVARRLSYALMGFKDATRVRTVQFHQSYAYEDFVQGFRPTGSGFSLRDGVFLNFCKRALEDSLDHKYVFIIDEINRGNLSKILGELMLLIEPDKRKSEWAVKLAYAESADERFYVPANVYILGMMNTADRSLAVVDYALRRRFAFATLHPCFKQSSFKATLSQRGVEGALIDRIILGMSALNAEIASDTANLGPGYCVGHSFFVPSRVQEKLDASWYRNVITSEVLPLLEEYWFEQPEKVNLWRNELLA